MNDVTVQLGGAGAGSAVGTPTVYTKSNLAAQLLNAAAGAARTAKVFEGSDPLACMQQSTVAIVMASAAIEACPNEIITDILDNSRGTLEQRKALKELRDSEDGRLLKLTEKMKSMAKELDTPGGITKIGQWPYQHLQLLLKLRNGLVHFRPEAEPIKDIERVFGTSLFNEGEKNFPIRCLHYGAAKKAVKIVREASHDFSAVLSGVIEVKDRLMEQPPFDFNVP